MHRGVQRYTKNAGDGVLVCILSASRNEERLSSIGARRSARPLEFPDMPCMKRVYKDKEASIHWSADSNEERSRSRG